MSYDNDKWKMSFSPCMAKADGSCYRLVSLDGASKSIEIGRSGIESSLMIFLDDVKK